MKIFPVLSLFFSLVLTSCATVAREDIRELKLYGMIIDNFCAAQHKEDIDEFSKTYSKDKALNCTLGYAFYSTSGIREFDSESNEKITRYLRDKKSELNAGIKCYELNNKLHLVEIIIPER
ncbi:MAG: hypothetical protein A2452_11990 [Candidatus Firestonebacteria bacterium RIFOXYC2_FULL_39_67]|nr:MAG: hypothetical protein A2536_00345 [Candidatus Firestonebacteria bacterium RIFOXYD2_FULL_39_29]OGF55687.1 MAG: hypothetical protein A2452_11990 [Candidatus Firestonebacteria bacterium RIFOXYC2_FULL_39_67]OGF57905.1 MAG: hypothetical protein A2497_04315 [Candidatus Firestonebacteria bacterium RifOxyC12_full_39_7]